MNTHRTVRLRQSFPSHAIDQAMKANVELDAISAIRKWDPHSKSIAVIAGALGCGKTIAATWWAINNPNHPHVAFLRAIDLARTSRYTPAPWRDAQALVLDDLGAEFSDTKGSFATDLYDLVDLFYSRDRPVVITTNLLAQDFRERYGARVSERVIESGVWITVTSASLRNP